MKSLLWPSLVTCAFLLAGCMPAQGGAAKAPGGPPVPPAPPAAPGAVPPIAAPAGVQAAPAAAPAAANTSGRLWVVVRNLKVKNLGIDTEISADWEVVQGSPEPGAKYVLRVSDGDSGSFIEHYVDFDIDLAKRKGTVSEGVRGPTLGIGGGMVAVVGKQGAGRDGLDPVSGKLKPGQTASEAQPPPTVAESAGASAQGMPIAIANPRREGGGFGPPGRGWAVDYQIQGTITPGNRYFWVVQDASGGAIEFDVTSDLTLNRGKNSGTFSGSAIGPSRLNGQLKMFIEKRGLGFGRRSEGTPVSNTVTFN